MKYKNFIRQDISIKILSNYPFSLAKVEEDFEKFMEKLENYDFGVWVDKKNLLKLNEIKIYNNLGEKIEWHELVLNYLNFLNTFMREQIGVCVEKTLPRIIDNELTYLIIQRKNYKDFDNNFFIAMNGEVIFPMISKEFDINLALIKLAEWKNRAKKNLVKFLKN